MLLTQATGWLASITLTLLADFLFHVDVILYLSLFLTAGFTCEPDTAFHIHKYCRTREAVLRESVKDSKNQKAREK